MSTRLLCWLALALSTIGCFSDSGFAGQSSNNPSQNPGSVLYARKCSLLPV